MDGIFRFTLPQNARVFISARATTLWNKDCSHGVQFRVPLADGPACADRPALAASSVILCPAAALVWRRRLLNSTLQCNPGRIYAAEDNARFDTAGSAAGVASFAMRTGAVVPLVGDYASFSPRLGTPTISRLFTRQSPTRIREHRSRSWDFQYVATRLSPTAHRWRCREVSYGSRYVGSSSGSAAVSSVLVHRRYSCRLGDYSAFYAALCQRMIFHPHTRRSFIHTHVHR